MTTGKMNTSNFKLAICMLFDPVIHGMDEASSPGILNHYLVVYTIELDEFYNNDYKDIIEIVKFNYDQQQQQTAYIRQEQQTAYIRGSGQEHQMGRAPKLDIIQCDELIGLEQVGYIKTFWLKIVQRRWKKVYKERQEMLKQRSSIVALKERQQNGQWPKHLRQWPKFTLNLP